MRVTGEKQLISTLRDIAGKKANGILRRVINQATKPLVKLFKLNAPIGKGYLQKSIIRKTVMRKGTIIAIIGPSMKKFEGKIRPGRYGRLVERGHGGPHRAGAHPYFAPVWLREVSGVDNRIKEGLRSEMTRLNKA